MNRFSLKPLFCSAVIALSFTWSLCVSASQNTYTQALPLWQAVLDEYVDEEGRTDFVALAQDKQGLAQFVDVIEKVGPTSNPEWFPTKNHVLAYHTNAYNALAMWGVLERDIPENFSSLYKRASFFKFRSILVDGDKTSLSDYENKVIRPLDEPRIHFALNCMVKDCPRLPKQYFTADRLEEDLQALTIEFFSKDKHIVVNDEKEILYLSSILKFYTKDFVPSRKKQDLVGYVNQYREIKIPENYRVKYIDYDWTINQRPGVN